MFPESTTQLDMLTKRVIELKYTKCLWPSHHRALPGLTGLFLGPPGLPLDPFGAALGSLWRRSVSLAGWLMAGRLAGCWLAGWPAGWLAADWLAGWLAAGWLAGWAGCAGWPLGDPFGPGAHSRGFIWALLVPFGPRAPFGPFIYWALLGPFK